MGTQELIGKWPNLVLRVISVVRLYSHRNDNSELWVSPRGVFNDGDQSRFMDHP